MALKKGKILTVKEKKLRNTKLQDIRDSEIKLNFTVYDDYLEVDIKLDKILEPAPRARTSGIYKKNADGKVEMIGSRLYDPLSAYKDFLKNSFVSYFHNNDVGIELPFKGEVDVLLTLVKVPPKSWSNKDKYFAIQGSLPFIYKPDVDNVEKTLFDCLNKILFKDDCQITTNKTNKIFGYSDSTHAVLRLYKEDKLPSRLSKEQTIEWKEIETKLKYNNEGDK